MIYTTRLLALIVAIIGVQSLMGQEPKNVISPKGFVASGNFKSIDQDMKSISIETEFGAKKEVRSFILADSVQVQARVSAKSEVVKLSDLVAGERLILISDLESKKITRIVLPQASQTSVLGEFKSIDRDQITITVQAGLQGSATGKREDKSFPLADSVDVKLQLKPGVLKLTDLVPGDQLALTIDPESKKVKRIGVAAAAIPSGALKEIDLEKKFIVVAPASRDCVRVPLGDKVTVVKYYRNIPIGDVKPGMEVKVWLGDDRKSVGHMTVSEPNARSIIGVIQAFDATKRTITVDRPTFGRFKPTEPTTYKIADNAAIKIGDMEQKLTDLVTGISISAYAEKDTIVGLSVLFSRGRRGSIAKVDVKASTVTINVYDETVTCVVNLNTKIKQAFKDVALADLKEGQNIMFKLNADQKTAEYITVIPELGP